MKIHKIYYGSLPISHIYHGGRKIWWATSDRIIAAMSDVSLIFTASMSLEEMRELCDTGVMSLSNVNANALPGDGVYVFTGAMSGSDASAIMHKTISLGTVNVILISSVTTRVDKSKPIVPELIFWASNASTGRASASVSISLSTDFLEIADAELNVSESKVGIIDRSVSLDDHNTGRLSKSVVNYMNEDTELSSYLNATNSEAQAHYVDTVVSSSYLADTRISDGIAATVNGLVFSDNVFSMYMPNSATAATYKNICTESETAIRNTGVGEVDIPVDLRSSASVIFHWSDISEPCVFVETDAEIHALIENTDSVGIETPGVTNLTVFGKVNQSAVASTLAEKDTKADIQADLAMSTTVTQYATQTARLDACVTSHESLTTAMEHYAEMCLTENAAANQSQSIVISIYSVMYSGTISVINTSDTRQMRISKSVSQKNEVNSCIDDTAQLNIFDSVRILTNNTELCFTQPVAGNVNEKCELKNITTLNIWAKHVRSGTNLLIRQPYNILQEGVNLLII